VPTRRAHRAAQGVALLRAAHLAMMQGAVRRIAAGGQIGRGNRFSQRGYARQKQGNNRQDSREFAYNLLQLGSAFHGDHTRDARALQYKSK